jgi:DNA polymerase-3 subunit beta
MKLTATAGALRTALNIARQAIPSTPSLLAYSAVQLVVDNDSLRITGSDGDTTIVTSLPLEGSIAGTVLVLPKPIHSYLMTLESDRLVTISLTEQLDELSVTPVGSSAYRFRTVSSTYPQPAIASGKLLPVNFSKLSAALGAVRTAVAKDNPVVQIVSSDSMLVLHATDNYRLTRAELPEAAFGTFLGVLPLSVLDRVTKLEPTSVTIDSRAKVISFSSESTTVTSRLLAVPFPAVEGVLESSPPNAATILSSRLVEACSRLASVTESSPVRCRLSKSTLDLDVTNADLGSGEEQVDLMSHNSEVVFEFLARLTYLQDAVNATSASEVTLAYSGPVQPLFITGTESLKVTTVVMPVRG